MKKTLLILALLFSALSFKAYSQEQKQIQTQEEPILIQVQEQKSKTKYQGEVSYANMLLFIHNIETIHGFRINPYFFIGVGTGIHLNMSATGVSMPVFANAKAYLFDKRFSPYLSVSLGYNIGLEDMEENGFYFSPGIGVTIKLRSKFLNVGFAYQMPSRHTPGPHPYISEFNVTILSKIAFVF